MVEDYKKTVERNYIFKEPMKAYAYFALFQYIVVNNSADAEPVAYKRTHRVGKKSRQP